MSTRPAYVWVGLLAFLGTLAAITGLLLAHIDPLPLVAFLGSIPAAIAGIVNVLRTNRVETKVDGVAKNVNGHLSRLSDAAGLPPGNDPHANGGTP